MTIRIADLQDITGHPRFVAEQPRAFFQFCVGHGPAGPTPGGDPLKSPAPSRKNQKPLLRKKEMPAPVNLF